MLNWRYKMSAKKKSKKDKGKSKMTRQELEKISGGASKPVGGRKYS